ncbi:MULTISPECIES: YrhK family protein [Falsihalocynthiibacter]|uniref:YrhK family protein n=1 Tax=Falsihalocynthiibacter TaxID=2854182 RepID=UPI0030026FAE
MPHLFVNRPRLTDPTSSNADLRKNFLWETINTAVYLVGGIVFVIGSILFLPALAAYADLGAWIFFGGSLLYLLVTGHDLFEVRRHLREIVGVKTVWDKLEFWAALSYTAGSVLFTIGSLLFLSPGALFIAGAWCFVIGSLLFVLGAVINVLEIVLAKDLITLQLMNLTALTFVTGSTLFAVASIPYLMALNDPADRTTIDAFLAWQYIVGSVLFFAGGVFNYWRTCVIMRQEIRAALVGNATQ